MTNQPEDRVSCGSSTPRPAYRWHSLLFLSISLLVISIDNTILNVGLPAIARRFSASASTLQWVVDAYILVFASLLLTMGSFGDRFGRKRILQLGLVIFAFGSVLAAQATSAKILVAARAFLGIGGATIMPATLSCIVASFPDPGERRKAIALWAATFGLGVALGPLVGGAVLSHFDWSAIFYINLPVVAVAIIGGQIFIAESRDSQSRPVDFLGVVLSIGGLFSLVYGIIEAGSHGWTAPQVLVAGGIAFLLLGAFLLWELRYRHAMLPLHFFRNRYFAGANFALVLIFFANYGSVFFLSQYFQSVQGNSAFHTGVLLLPMALLATIGSGLSARLGGRLGPRLTISAGMVLAAGGLLMMSYAVAKDTAYSAILPSLSLFAFGLGLAIPTATNTVMGTLPVDKAGIGSGLNDTTRQIGGALGVAILGTIMNHNYTQGMESLLFRMDSSAPQFTSLIRSSIQGAHSAATKLPSAMGTEMLEAADRSFTQGMGQAMATGAVLLGVAGLFVFLFVPRHQPESAGMHENSTMDTE